LPVLLDTHAFLWWCEDSSELSPIARKTIAEQDCFVSLASFWEIAIKHTLGRDEFRVDVRPLRRGLLDNGYDELAVTSAHAVALDILPPLHKDPFDRMLLAQAHVEGIMLQTADAIVATYPVMVQKV